MASTINQEHAVAFPYQGAWGHARPLINLSARLVQMKTGVTVTLLASDMLHARAKIALARSFGLGEEVYARRVRLVSVGGGAATNVDTIDECFTSFWEKLDAEKEIVCAASGECLAALPKSDVAVIDDASREFDQDILLDEQLDIRALPTLWTEKLGGRGEARAKLEQEVARTGRTYQKIAVEFPVPRDIGLKLFPDVTLESCDGVFLVTMEPYESTAVTALREWYAETGRPAGLCRLLLPSGTHAVEHEQKQSEESMEIQEFLDAMLRTARNKSLLYILLGSISWPVMTPEKLWVFLDVVMKRNIPFILNRASRMAVIPDEARGKVKAYGKDLLILWSFHADQPTNVVNVADVLQVGYELLEVRTGHGLHPILRNGRKPVGTIDALQAEAREVLAKAYGADGVEKRRRLQVLRTAVLSEWEEGGSATRDVAAFLESL
ncbi:hypothetical protein BD413DRAFT_493271 [Trametes elegans]|nr:hypothetical protein BD413DRAFT_493271 [Trametes elegans]